MPIPINKQARAILTGLVETFESIDRVNGLEQAESELRVKIEQNRKEADAILAHAAAQARQDMAKAGEFRHAAMDELGKAKAEADRILADAKAQAERELAAARGELLAQQTTAQDAEERAKAAAAELKQTQDTLSHLNAQVADATAIIAKAERIKKAAE